MGPTIHYALRSNLPKPKQAHFLVSALRRRALDLPFESVGEIIERSGSDCDFNQCSEDDPHRWLLIQAGRCVKLPCGDGCHCVKVTPTELVAFETFPGPGCEPANIGLCRYPATIEVNAPECRDSKRRLRTNLAGWSWSSFCKTRGAAHQECGGFANFLRCHLSVVHLLDYAKQIHILSGVTDEGEFWENRNAEWLTRQWNEMVATAFGKPQNRLGEAVASAIAMSPDVEARGPDAAHVS